MNSFEFSLIYFSTNSFTEFKPGLPISRKDRKHMVANTFFKLSRYTLVFIWL